MANFLGFHLKETMEQLMAPMEELEEKSGKQIFLQEKVCHIFLDDPDVAIALVIG